MHYLIQSSLLTILVLFLACRNEVRTPPLSPEDVLIKWQGFIDQDLYDSAHVYSTGEAIEFVDFLRSITDYNDPDRVLSITLLRDLQCAIQGDSAVCSYITKDEVGADIPDTVILYRVDERWLVGRVYVGGDPPLDSLLESDTDLLFPPDSEEE